IDRDVVGDLEQPARQLEFRTVPVDVIQNLDEGVLRQILGELAIAHHAVAEGEYRPLVTPDQFSERRVSPLLRQRSDIGVRQMEEVEGWRHLAGWARRIVMRRTGLLQST